MELLKGHDVNGTIIRNQVNASEFVGYIQLAELKNVANEVHFTFNKSVIMATYMLCGFANSASINWNSNWRNWFFSTKPKKTLSELGKAVLGGSLASLLSATIAGMIIGLICNFRILTSLTELICNNITIW